MAKDTLLNTYNEERRPIAHGVIRDTTIGSKFLVSLHWTTTFLRNFFTQYVLTLTMTQKFLSPHIGMLDLSYSSSSLTKNSYLRMPNIIATRPQIGNLVPFLSIGSILFNNIDVEEDTLDLSTISRGLSGFTLLYIKSTATIPSIIQLSQSLRNSGYTKSSKFLRICVVIREQDEESFESENSKKLFDCVAIDTTYEHIHKSFGNKPTAVLIRPDWHIASISIYPTPKVISSYFHNHIIQ